MKIVTADFIGAAEKRQDYPLQGVAEVAFAGRSNVGKSSIINTLLGRRNLVRTSKTPGRTRQLNFFLINGRFVFVDLPGYGFAAVPMEMKRKWGPMVETYLKERAELSGVVVIVDARMPPTESDKSLMEFLIHHRIPLVVAATKSDKLTHSQMLGRRRSITEGIGSDVPVILFSSHSGEGKNELWKEIKKLIELRRPQTGI